MALAAGGRPGCYARETVKDRESEQMPEQKARPKPGHKLYEDSVVVTLRGALTEAKEHRKQRLSRREIIEQLKAELQEMLRSRWTYDELVELLAKKDFEVSAPMLREVLRTPKKRSPASRTSSKSP